MGSFFVSKKAGVLVVGITFVLSGFSIPQQTHAFVEEVVAGAGACAGTALISQLIGLIPTDINDAADFVKVPVNDASVEAEEEEGNLKEQILDCIAWTLANVALEQITAETVNWINSGFDGNPAYVEDLGGFLEGVGDETVGRFLEGTEFAQYICEPYQFDIQLQIVQQDQFVERASCTLTDVVENIENFVDGNFAEGGWEGWFSLTQNPQNNIYGARLIAQDELTNRLFNKVGLEEDTLNFGRGFFAQEKCDEVIEQRLVGYDDPIRNPFTGQIIGGTPRYEEQTVKANCRTVTPGSVIDQQLDGVLKIGGQRLNIADELNEILSALLSQLLIEIFHSEDGLQAAPELVETLEGTELPDEFDLGIHPDWACNYTFGGEAASKKVKTDLASHTVTSENFDIAPRTRRQIPLEKQKFYEKMVVQADVYVDEILGRTFGKFDGALNVHRSRPTGDYGGYWGTGIAKGNRTFIDIALEKFTDGSTTNWQEKTTHRMVVTQDAIAGTVRSDVFDTGGNFLGGTIISAPRAMDIIDTGDGLYLYYYDNLNWRYENVSVEVTPGGPHNGGARGVCGLDGGGGGGTDTFGGTTGTGIDF